MDDADKRERRRGFNRNRARTVTFLPEPEPAERRFTLISVDDHVVEPRDVFEDRVPRRFAEAAPRVVERDGRETWLFDGEQPDLGLNAVAWVAGLLDRLDHVARYQELYGTWSTSEPSPADVLKRNFWFCAIEDPANFRLRDRIGVENLMVESDYPHLDSTWPHTQRIVADSIGDFPTDEIRKITWENASTLFRHPVPPGVQADPNAY